MMSSQSSAPPPPPPPLPATPAWLLVAAVTVRVADAGAALLPAGPVTRALAGMLAVYTPAVALCTLKEISQLPPAGIFAPDRVTPPAVLVGAKAAPPQVLAGAGEPSVKLAGSDTVIPDWIKAKALELPKVTTSMAGAFAATLAGESAALTVGAAGVTVMGAMQALALVPAQGGAMVLAPPAVTVTPAVSGLPARAGTTRVTGPAPLEGTFSWSRVAPELMVTAPVLDQA